MARPASLGERAVDRPERPHASPRSGSSRGSPQVGLRPPALALAEAVAER